jgi:hypothetical protein
VLESIDVGIAYLSQDEAVCLQNRWRPNILPKLRNAFAREWAGRGGERRFASVQQKRMVLAVLQPKAIDLVWTDQAPNESASHRWKFDVDPLLSHPAWDWLTALVEAIERSGVIFADNESHSQPCGTNIQSARPDAREHCSPRKFNWL